MPTACRYALRLRRCLAELAPDLVHSNGLKMHLFTRFARPPRTPIVWHVHDFYGLRPVVSRIIRRFRHGVVAAVAISQAVADDVRRVLPGLPVEVILNAIDTNHFRPGEADGEWLDRLAGFPPAPLGTIRVGLVGTFARWKGHGVFLEAAARLATKLESPPVRFYVVGGPIYLTAAQFSLEELNRRAVDLGLAGRLGFVGLVPEVANAYRALDVVVHASTQPEPFGLTVAEAMACGRAVIVSSAGGAAELFTPEHDALGVPPGDIGALADALQRLVTDAELRRRLGENARQTAVRRFALERFGIQLSSLYRTILGFR